jgi:hypothetical protein
MASRILFQIGTSGFGSCVGACGISWCLGLACPAALNRFVGAVLDCPAALNLLYASPCEAFCLFFSMASCASLKGSKPP